jgi:hypothetical protein
VNASRFGIGCHLIKQNRLPDAPKTYQDLALAWIADPDALDRDSNFVAKVVTSSQLGRGTSCAWTKAFG